MPTLFAETYSLERTCHCGSLIGPDVQTRMESGPLAGHRLANPIAHWRCRALAPYESTSSCRWHRCCDFALRLAAWQDVSARLSMTRPGVQRLRSRSGQTTGRFSCPSGPATNRSSGSHESARQRMIKPRLGRSRDGRTGDYAELQPLLNHRPESRLCVEGRERRVLSCQSPREPAAARRPDGRPCASVPTVRPRNRPVASGLRSANPATCRLDRR